MTFGIQSPAPLSTLKVQCRGFPQLVQRSFTGSAAIARGNQMGCRPAGQRRCWRVLCAYEISTEQRQKINHHSSQRQELQPQIRSCLSSKISLALRQSSHLVQIQGSTTPPPACKVPTCLPRQMCAKNVKNQRIARQCVIR